VSEFYLAALLLLLAAVAVVSFPWWAARSKKSADPLSNSLSNTQLIKQRLEELDKEQQQGLLDEDALAHAQKELKLALLDEVAPEQAKGASSVIALASGLVLSLSVAGGVYFYANQIQEIQDWQGAIDRLPELGKRIVVQGDQSIQAEDLQDFALGLRSRLAEQPEDATGWLLLGRVLAAVNNVDSALQAFTRSLDLEPDNTGALVSYSQALMSLGQEQGISQARGLLQRTLELEPDNTNAMGMLALVAAELGDKDLAIKNWQNLQTFIPQSDPSYASITQRIAELRGVEIGDAGMDSIKPKGQGEIKTDNAPSAGDLTVLSIRIELDAALQNKLPADGFLFVFALDASGAVRMPAAVVKTRLAALPITIELSDANAMMPTHKLSQLSEARLVARISEDENVVQAMGDLQGEVRMTVQAGTRSQQQITINKEIL
jgi:cytochrome c-type biogenesis protein CcmI